MSYTELKIVTENGDVEGFSEYKNSWGFAAFVWDMLCAKYGVEELYRRDKNKSKSREPYLMPGDTWQYLWECVKEDKIKLKTWESNVLFSTYDDAIVKRDDLLQLADDYDMFAEALRPEGRVCHLRSIAKDMRKAYEQGALGICFYAMSVGDDPWYGVYTEENPDDMELDYGTEEYNKQEELWEDSYRPYNVNTDSKHWYVELK